MLPSLPRLSENFGIGPSRLLAYQFGGLIMLHNRTNQILTSRLIATGTAVVAVAAIFGGIALAAQDRFTLKVPNGPAFSEFKGYENWQYVASSQTEMGLKVIA